MYRTFLVAQMVKNLPALQETWVWSLGQEDLLEKEMATHSSILAWRIPWTEEACRRHSVELQKVRHDWLTKHSTAQQNLGPDPNFLDSKFSKLTITSYSTQVSHGHQEQKQPTQKLGGGFLFCFVLFKHWFLTKVDLFWNCVLSLDKTLNSVILCKKANVSTPNF